MTIWYRNNSDRKPDCSAHWDKLKHQTNILLLVCCPARPVDARWEPGFQLSRGFVAQVCQRRTKMTFSTDTTEGMPKPSRSNRSEAWTGWATTGLLKSLHHWLAPMVKPWQLEMRTYPILLEHYKIFILISGGLLCEEMLVLSTVAPACIHHYFVLMKTKIIWGVFSTTWALQRPLSLSRS